MFFRSWKGALCGALLGANSVAAIDLDLGQPDSIKKAAQTVAKGMRKYYTGDKPGDIPGNLPDPYYWWEAGAMFGSFIDYWYYTKDTQFNDITTQALLHQVGANKAFMPDNQTRTLGNDDQAFWGMAALTAAENGFPDPPPDQPQWLALAQAVFNTQAPRWDNATCNGGLKWQIYPFNNGYNYKNTISNGCFFNMAARLGRYTGNQSYVNWADEMWDWTAGSGLMSDDYHFYDGTDDRQNCSEVNHIQWTYNAGVYLYGAATMWNITNADKWRKRTEGIIAGLSVFFEGEIMFEVACEVTGTCNVDQRSFKAYLSRWMAATVKVASWTNELLMPRIRSSAKAAALQCSGAPDGVTCGLRWTAGAAYDGEAGVGEQMSALEVIQANLIDKVDGPVTANNGGTSKGDAGAGAEEVVNPRTYNVITTGDKVGAGFLTTILLAGLLGGAWWMIA
ncbi:mannan endo-1,6-alpha-mannosidase DCW1 precursor [Eremomyces bilateralis CBS 781.70]|uniref:Mannan endo-1,6-alpha-mannosidase n=1 Tax=Eremomyces bilateralis CBS 781.70 TaxID=1392243 RepID=A0A6G1FSR7_9PEZI|nr:mannan endo-1,6-alpha-mannosidase DCW1 precursor [Eremomyces bilateralis CBS 781.70]KAF1808758.1 mannan endo-1,6-alpha-mannosidase DCW1 precursor [Eremomyces bilateralis CBS 781.70]